MEVFLRKLPHLLHLPLLHPALTLEYLSYQWDPLSVHRIIEVPQAIPVTLIFPEAQG